MLDNVYPASYRFKNFLTLPKVWGKPLFQAPPTFYNRKPLWYPEYVKNHGEEAANGRLETGAIWAGIPEEEIPRTIYTSNADGTYRMTEKGVGPYTYGIERINDVPQTSDFDEGVGQTLTWQDTFTKPQVGGTHSDYTYMGDQEDGSVI